jgi:dTDP-4-amino-4,6-dideoxygalactose transaminase
MASKIPCLDIKRQYQQIQSEVTAVLQAVCEATAFADGPFVAQFEKHFAEFCHMRFAVGLNSGTSALHLVLRVLGIKAGDEVIVPANTFIATAWAVSYVGATPVFVDCTADTWNIDPAAIAAKISPRTKAIIGVHLYGQPFDLEAVSAIARTHRLWLVEDCAQAHGAGYKGKHVGRFGEMGCFSFYPGKNLGAYGEGGAIVTNNAISDQRIRSLRNHGSTVRYYHDEIGYNMRMDGMQGAILDLKLKYLVEWNAKRQVIARRYQQEITNPKIIMQKQPEWAESVYHLFVVTTENRDGLLKHLHEHNIYPGLHYPVPCHLQKAYAHLGYKPGDCPNAEYLSNHCLSLPMFAELTPDEVSKVIEVLNKF